MRAGISAVDFANPDTRVPHSVAVALLDDAVRSTENPALGLLAGQLVEAGDLEVLEYAARTCFTVGDAIDCVARYLRLLHDAVEICVVRGVDQVVFGLRMAEDVRQLPSANDFMLAMAMGFFQRNAAGDVSPLEVRLSHPAPSHAATYGRFFSAPVQFGAPFNALVLRPDCLRIPMIHADAQLCRAFSLRAEQLLDELRRRDGTAGRVRDAVAHRGVGGATMAWTACHLGMSVATLRRRLEAEGTTFSEVVDSVRRNLAERHLQEGTTTITEVAYSLGFSSVSAFHRAFKRWTGSAPAAYRSRHRTQSEPPMAASAV